MSYLTPAQTAALQAWLDTAMPILRLSHWDLVAHAELPEEHPDAYAASFLRDYSDAGRVMLGPSFWPQDREHRRETLVHELIHAHLYRTRNLFQDTTTALGREVRDFAREQYKTLEELAIEQLARIIAPLVPYPDIPDPDAAG